jgi:hypothetical protein
MKKFKIGFWVTVLGFIFLIIYQNNTFFLGKQSLGINLWVANYRTPEIYNLALFFICFVAGLLLGSYFVLMDRLKYSKKIKMLNADRDSHQAEISALQNERDTLKLAAAEIDAKTVVISAESQEPAEAQEQQQ